MIRIHLSGEDVARIRLATTPDYGLELMSGGAEAADRGVPGTPRLARWRREVRRRQTLDSLHTVTGLYTVRFQPGMVGQPEQLVVPELVTYLECMSGDNGLNRFNRRLVTGDEEAYRRLHQALVGFRETAVEPYRRRISSAVARTGARAGAQAAALGIGAALSNLHPKIRWDGEALSLDTVFSGDYELQGRTLVMRPLGLASGILLIDDAEPGVITVGYPTPFPVATPDQALRTPSPALIALLGASRAATLTTVAWSPGISTGQLADVLGLSPATASRHATVLREAGLMESVREAQAVRHRITRLGRDLIADAERP